MPPWILDAVREVVAGVDDPSPLRKRWRASAKDAIDLVRFLEVEKGLGWGEHAGLPGLTWERAWKLASESLYGSKAAGSVDVIAKSYKRVKRLAKESPDRYQQRSKPPDAASTLESSKLSTERCGGYRRK